jgi:hypothetical protein
VAGPRPAAVRVCRPQPPLAVIRLKHCRKSSFGPAIVLWVMAFCHGRLCLCVVLDIVDHGDMAVGTCSFLTVSKKMFSDCSCRDHLYYDDVPPPKLV